jgi:uncharacterized protein (TIGR02147 family)
MEEMIKLNSDISVFLGDVLTKRQEKNPKYSLRAFARDLGISPGRVSELLHGRRLPGRDLILRIADALKLSPLETESLFRLVHRQKLVHKENGGARQLLADEYALIADLECYGLLMLMETEGFKSDIEWMANRLNVTPLRVQSILERLERLNLIRCQAGVYERLQHRVTSTHDTPSDVLKESHANVMKHAMEALYTVDLPLRDITSITIPADPDKLSQAKEEIRLFRRKMAKLMGSGHKREVYNLNIQLVPMTR